MNWKDKLHCTVMCVVIVVILLILFMSLFAADQVKPPKFGDSPTLQHCFELGGVEYHQDQGGLSTCVWRK